MYRRKGGKKYQGLSKQEEEAGAAGCRLRQHDAHGRRCWAAAGGWRARGCSGDWEQEMKEMDSLELQLSDDGGGPERDRHTEGGGATR